MRLIHAILLLLLAILGLLIVLLVSADPADATGQAHARIADMNVGGDGLARLGGRGWLMCLLQTLTLLLIYALIALGVSERRRTARFWILLAVGAGLSLAVWWGMFFSYMAFLETGSAPLLLGYPLPTAFMLFGVFLGGSYLCVLYILGFRQFIYPEEEEAAYEALRARAAEPRKPDATAGGSRR